MPVLRTALLKIFAVVCLALSSSLSQSQDIDSLDQFDIDHLMAMEVESTSAMKRPETVTNTPSSIYVLERDQILASGALSMIDMLRLIPGVQVRQIDNSNSAVGIRFAGSATASKLLVMIDGLSVYNPVISATYWQQIQVSPHLIDRIEVVRGQTGIMWGLNAFNGVINIITRQALDTPNLRVHQAVGSQNEVVTNLSYGASPSDKSSYRLHLNYQAKDDSDSLPTSVSHDAFHAYTLGAQYDFSPNDDSYYSTKVSYFGGDYNQTTRLPMQQSNLNMAVFESIRRERFSIANQISKRLSPDTSYLANINLTSSESNSLIADEDFLMFDADFQMNTRIDQHHFDWGINLRHNQFDFANDVYTFDLDQPNRIRHFGAFAQIQLNLMNDNLRVTGANFSSYNDYTQWQHQPSLRAILCLAETHRLWASASTAARTPSYVEYDAIVQVGGLRIGDYLQTGLPQVDEVRINSVVSGSSDIDSEKSKSLELGYRFSGQNSSLDISIFNNQSSNVLGYEPQVNTTQVLRAFALFQQGMIDEAVAEILASDAQMALVANLNLDVKGSEAVWKWSVNQRLSTEFGFSYTNIDYKNLRNGQFPAISIDSSIRQFTTKIHYKLDDKHQFFVLHRQEQGQSYRSDDIASNTLSWRYTPSPNQSWTLLARNLFTGSQQEYGIRNEIQVLPTARTESVQLQFSYQF